MRGNEWELIKILLEGDDYSNKTNTTSQNMSPAQLPKLAKTTYPLECYWSYEPTTQPNEPNTPTTQRKTAQHIVCVTPVRSMAPIGQTDGTSQIGGL
jgi:hypothetical protein